MYPQYENVICRSGPICPYADARAKRSSSGGRLLSRTRKIKKKKTDQNVPALSQGDGVTIKLVLVSGKSASFLFPSSSTASEITEAVHAAWPAGEAYCRLRVIRAGAGGV